MGRLVVGAFQSLDGVMQAPGGPDEDRENGFLLGGWSVPFWDEEMMAFQAEELKRFDALLMGRKTYDIFATSWPRADEDTDLFAAKLNAMPKFLVTRNGSKYEWNNTTMIGGNVVERVRALKEKDSETLWTQGSTELLKALFQADLVDEIALWTFPVVLGRGKRLFPEGAMPGTYRATEARNFSTGVYYVRLQKRGPLEFGEMAVEGEAGIR